VCQQQKKRFKPTKKERVQNFVAANQLQIYSKIACSVPCRLATGAQGIA
jgi:hypothetical protein